MILINGKMVNNIAEEEEDLNSIVGNCDYIENQYIDYKEMFSFWDERLPPNVQKQRCGDYYKPQIDRNLIMSSIVEVDDMSSEEMLNESIRNLKYEYFMALGIRSEEKYKQVETAIYI